MVNRAPRRRKMSNSEEDEGLMPCTRKKRRGMIEKRRRDKINHSLSELRRLVPAAFEKQGSAKLEKAEILQMTVDYLTMLHSRGLIGDNTNKQQLLPSQSIVHDQLSPTNSQAQANLVISQSQDHLQATQTNHVSQSNSLHSQPIDNHNNHNIHHHQQSQQQQQNINNASAQVASAATAAAMLGVQNSTSVAQNSIIASTANSSHHLYNQHHMSSAAAAYHQLNNPLGTSEMAGNVHGVKMDPHQSSLVIQHPHHHPSLLNLDYHHHHHHQAHCQPLWNQF